MCAVGTGGTLTGTARYLKEKNAAVNVVAVEPKNSAILSGGQVGAHKIQGIGANFIPENFDKSLCDGIIAVSDDDAINYAKKICLEEGLLVGISSGAALSVGVSLAKKEEYRNKKIGYTLTNHIMCDHDYRRYLVKIADNNSSAKKILESIGFEIFDEESATGLEKQNLNINNYLYMICDNPRLRG